MNNTFTSNRSKPAYFCRFLVWLCALAYVWNLNQQKSGLFISTVTCAGACFVRALTLHFKTATIPRNCLYRISFSFIKSFLRQDVRYEEVTKRHSTNCGFWLQKPRPSYWLIIRRQTLKFSLCSKFRGWNMGCQGQMPSYGPKLYFGGPLKYGQT